MPKRSDDPGRMRQDSGFAAQNPSHSTLIASATSLSLLSNPSHQVSSFTATAAAASKAQDYSKDQDYNPTDDDRIDLLKSSKSKDGRFRILKKDKIEFLEEVVSNQKNISSEIKAVDKHDKRGLQRRFQSVLFHFNKKDKRSKGSVEAIAQWI